MTKKNDYENFLQALGESFALVRKRSQLTQAEFGAKTGRGQSAIGKMERGPVPNVSLRVIYEMAEAFGVSLSELFQMTEGRLGKDGRGEDAVSWTKVAKVVDKLPKEKKESVTRIVGELLEMT